jgi:type 1 fimbria pilin
MYGEEKVKIKKMMAKMSGIAAVLLCGAQLSGVAQAETTINISGNLVVPACEINSNSPVNVTFGNIDMKDMIAINTPYQPREVAIPINCAYTSGAPILTLSGSVHDAAAGSIQTSKYAEGLIIYIRQADATTPINIGSPVDVTTSVNGGNLTLNFAVGIKEAGLLQPGNFTATATMALTYI